ncbi:MAG: Sir2 family NAD-dependent protein deacetylase [Aliidongia sp.]
MSSRSENDLTPESTCFDCGRSGTMRPHVVWFGEMPFEMDRIYRALAECDLFLSIGTSGTVYPAAGFRQQGRGRMARIRSNSTSEPSRRL